MPSATPSEVKRSEPDRVPLQCEHGRDAPAVFGPSADGWKAKTSLRVAGQARHGEGTRRREIEGRQTAIGSRPTNSPLTFSAAPLKPTSLPSKYIAHVPDVLAAERARRERQQILRLPPVVTRGTENAPDVEMTIVPSGNTATASMFSPVVVSPTSLPSKYISQIPEVSFPRL